MISCPACSRGPVMPDGPVPEYWNRRRVFCPCRRLCIDLRDMAWLVMAPGFMVVYRHDELFVIREDGKLQDPETALDRFLNECLLASVLES